VASAFIYLILPLWLVILELELYTAKFEVYPHVFPHSLWGINTQGKGEVAYLMPVLALLPLQQSHQKYN